MLVVVTSQAELVKISSVELVLVFYVEQVMISHIELVKTGGITDGTSHVTSNHDAYDIDTSQNCPFSLASMENKVMSCHANR